MSSLLVMSGACVSDLSLELVLSTLVPESEEDAGTSTLKPLRLTETAPPPPTPSTQGTTYSYIASPIYLYYYHHPCAVHLATHHSPHRPIRGKRIDSSIRRSQAPPGLLSISSNPDCDCDCNCARLRSPDPRCIQPHAPPSLLLRHGLLGPLRGALLQPGRAQRPAGRRARRSPLDALERRLRRHPAQPGRLPRLCWSCGDAGARARAARAQRHLQRRPLLDVRRGAGRGGHAQRRRAGRADLQRGGAAQAQARARERPREEAPRVPRRRHGLRLGAPAPRRAHPLRRRARLPHQYLLHARRLHPGAFPQLLDPGEPTPSSSLYPLLPPPYSSALAKPRSPPRVPICTSPRRTSGTTRTRATRHAGR